MIAVKIHKIFNDVKLPQIQTSGAAACDVYAYLEKPLVIEPMTRVAVATGFKVEILPNYFISVRPRSGLAINHGITLVNSPGTIDADFRGEVKILMINLSDKSYTIQPDERIAQLLLEKSVEFIWQESDTVSETSRAEGGFGSTGNS